MSQVPTIFSFQRIDFWPGWQDGTILQPGDTLGIKILKPPFISSLKMVGFVHFSNLLIPSEKYYNSQSFWITLYLNIAKGTTDPGY